MRLRHVLLFLAVFLYFFCLYSSPREILQIYINSKSVFILLIILAVSILSLLIYNVILDIYSSNKKILIKYLVLMFILIILETIKIDYIISLRKKQNYSDRENTEIYESRKKY